MISENDGSDLTDLVESIGKRKTQIFEKNRQTLSIIVRAVNSHKTQISHRIDPRYHGIFTAKELRGEKVFLNEKQKLP